MEPPLSTPNVTPGTGRASRWLRLLQVVGSAYLVCLIGTLLTLQWADLWWPATFLMFAPRWVFALPLGFLLPVAVFMRSRATVLVLVLGLLVCWPLTGLNVPWQQLTFQNPKGTRFRVLTLNMHFSKANPQPLEELIATTPLDIIAIQEWSGSAQATLQFTPGWHLHSIPGQFLASRYPINNVVQLGKDSMGQHASLARYELDTPVGIVHVFSLHAASSRKGISETIHENRKGALELEANSARRREQSVFVAGKAAECNGPLVIVGDFNTPPESAIFTEVWSNYTDAFGAGGWGFGYTFIGAKTTVRIDHILARRGWACASCYIGPFVGSPHRPVIAELVWTGDHQ